MPPLANELVAAIRQDPAVAAVDPVFQTRVNIKGKRRPVQEKTASGGAGKGSADSAPMGPGNAPTLVGTDAVEPPYSLIQGKWIHAGQPQRSEAAISKGLAAQLGVTVGDDVLVSNGKTEDEFPLKIVGIIEQRKAAPAAPFMTGLPPSRGPPLTHGPAVAALYVPWSLAEKLAGIPARIDFAGVVLTKGIAPEAFCATGLTEWLMPLRPPKSKPRRRSWPNSIKARPRRRSEGKPFRQPAFRSWLRCSSSSRRSTWESTSGFASLPCSGPSRSPKRKSAQ